MNEKAKSVNYSDELTAQIVERYEVGTTDEERAAILVELSEETGKKVQSLIAKLVAEKVYVKKTYVSKAGTKTETKGAIVAAIAGVLGVAEEQLAGLEKATKPTLTLIRAAFLSIPQIADSGETADH